VSITFSWRFSFRRVQAAMLSFIVQGRGRTRLVSPAQLLQEQVRQVANASIAVMGIWQVENCLEIKAYIACWHRCICTYRGYVLCSDTSERTFLMDTQTWTYVAITNAGLLQIDGVQEAKKFVDALCHLQEEEEAMRWNNQ
jgi:hypothetical protein